jgi:hemoglobin-like flavoprotein
MTPQQIGLVQGTWQQVLPIRETAARLFYGRLFETDPSLRALFKGDIDDQGKKLMAMLTMAVNGLTKLDAIVPAVQDLGRRHVAYGVKDSDYDTVGSALLWTLEQGLGSAFSAEVKEAWAAAYAVLAGAMKEAAAMRAA